MIRWLFIFLLSASSIMGVDTDSIKFNPRTFSLIEGVNYTLWAETNSELSGYGNVAGKRVVICNFGSALADAAFPVNAIITSAYLKVKVATKNTGNFNDWVGNLSVKGYGLLDSVGYDLMTIDSSGGEPWDTTFNPDAGLSGRPQYYIARDTSYYVGEKAFTAVPWSMGLSNPGLGFEVTNAVTVTTTENAWYQFDIKPSFATAMKGAGAGSIILMADSVGLFSSFRHRKIYNDSTYGWIIYEVADRAYGGGVTFGGGDY